MSKTLKRIALAGAGAVAAVTLAATPALADQNIVITHPDGRGKMTYIDDGDMFQVCDTKADGAGMTGQLYRNHAETLLTVTDGGDAGCDKKGYDVPSNGEYQMQLWWNGGGATVYSQWFNE
ncbi:hypothetical protein [Streptomyces sp. NBC_00299]|uniref:hypothetical protein n=1 Tax=Streptomyces sp. NBC_00299 TaxID=2975705 RepID=UPI002E2BFF7D|nr:hypothetical protein [Streptomyces sp. NBC_00299]